MAKHTHRWLGSAAAIAIAVVMSMLVAPEPCTATVSGKAGYAHGRSGKDSRHPHILFIVMDDVGIDQLTAFGNGGVINKPSTPTIDEITNDGVRFTSVWSMPECSPSRATFFTGRWPLRTGVNNAITDQMLPQGQVSPYEWTVPRVLATVGYTSAMVGKYHLGDQNPSESCSPATRGWDFFEGILAADPPSIDTTGGNTAPSGDLVCGFDPSRDPGACYFADETCEPIKANSLATTPARQCLESGGLFVSGEACDAARFDALAFDNDNAYYVWPKVETNGARSAPNGPDQCQRETVPIGSPDDCIPAPDGTCESQSRQYLTTVQTQDAAAWWNSQSGPRMLTVSYSAIHTPMQQPPTDLATQPANSNSFQCDAFEPSRLIGNWMLEAMDVEIARLLEAIGLATLDDEHKRIKRLYLDDTVVLILGDNGTFGANVKVADGYSLELAKGWVYETGVSVPLIIAGAGVRHPGRTVDALVNQADLFELFAEIAGVDAHAVVPASHQLDSRPMLPYLTHPGQQQIREFNYTELGAGVFPTPQQAPADPADVPGRSWPCVVGNGCVTTLINTEDTCDANDGTWFGPPNQPGDPFYATSCCTAIETMKENAMYPNVDFIILPVSQFAVRKGNLKLVLLKNVDCDAAPYTAATPPIDRPYPWAEYPTKDVYEFYELVPTPDNPAGIDKENLLRCGPGSDPDEPCTCVPRPLRRSCVELLGELQRIQNSEVPCPGDGNLDKVVNELDLQGVDAFMGAGPSYFDMNLDGQTDATDRQIVLDHFGDVCVDTRLHQPPGRMHESFTTVHVRYKKFRNDK